MKLTLNIKIVLATILTIILSLMFLQTLNTPVEQINLQYENIDLTQKEISKSSLNILNPQSYPQPKGIWEVQFKTNGTANLWISPINGTTWMTNEEATADLRFLSITCGNKEVEFEIVNNKLFIKDYNCSEITYERSQVETGGVHTIEFKFGNQTKFAKNFASSRGSGVLTYMTTTDVSVPRYMVFDPSTNSWSSESSAIDVVEDIQEMEVACSVARHECALVTVDSGADVEVQIYNGKCWGNGTTCGQTFTLETTTYGTIVKRANLMYESDSGDLLVVWSGNAIDIIQYRVWDGTSWSSESNILSGTLVTTGTPEWIELAQEPGTDNISMIYKTSTDQAGVIMYNGENGNWGCEMPTALTGLYGTNNFPTVDITHEQLSGDLFAVGGYNAATEFHYITKPFGSCTYTQSTSASINLNDDSDMIRIAPRYGTNEVLIATYEDGTVDDMDMARWTGSALSADGAGDTSMKSKGTSGNYLLAPVCSRNPSVNRCVLVYGDKAGTGVDNYPYTPSTNTWNTANGDYTGAPTMGTTEEAIQCSAYPFNGSDSIMCIFEDNNDEIFAKIYNASSNSWSSTETGTELVTSTTPTEYKSFSFNWVIFNAPYAPIPIDPYSGEVGVSLNKNLTVYIEDPNSDDLNIIYYWENGTVIPTSPVPSYWSDATSPYRQQINLSGATSDIYNYTIDLQLTSSNVGSGFDFTNYRNSLRFYYYNVSSGTSTLLPHYVSLWDSGSSQANVVVKTPILESGSNTEIYMYYGDTSKPNIEDYCSPYLYCDQFNDASISTNYTQTDQSGYGGMSISESGGVLSITAGGDDTWTGSDQYASLFLDDYGDDVDIRVAIMSQTNPNASAKAGIMVRNDMTASATSTGYTFMTITPGNGYSWQRDSDDNGFLDANNEAGAPSVTPSYVRLTKSGTAHAGYYSKTSPDSWTQVGTGATMATSNSIYDVGLSLTSHAGATTGTATFDNLTIRRFTTDTISDSFGGEETLGNYPSGSYATTEVNGLAANTTYYWYVVLSDGKYTIQGDIWNFTTKDLTPPTGYLISPSDGASTAQPSYIFSAYAEDGSGLDYATIHIWDEYGNYIAEENKSLDSNTTSTFGINISFIQSGTLIWNIEVFDTGGNHAYLGANRTITVNLPSVVVQYLDSSNPFYVRVNKLIPFVVNLSCLSGNCLDIDSTLYVTNLSENSSLEDLELGFGDWTPDAGTCTWIRNQDATPSNNVGPGGSNSAGTGFDHTLGTTTGWYAYVETSSNVCQGADLYAILEGTNFTAGTISTNLSFWYHMYGANMGDLHVDVFNGTTWVNNVWSVSGQQQGVGTDPYLHGTVDLSSYQGLINIRFRYDAVSGFTADAAIDDIEINTVSQIYIPLSTSSSDEIWTNSSNPQTISLNVNESKLITYYINGTVQDNIYTAYVGATLNSVFGIDGQGSQFNIIVSGSIPPVGYKLAPANNTITDNSSIELKVNSSSIYGIDYLTYNIWNSTGSLINSTSVDYNGEKIISEDAFNFTFPYDDTFTWNVLFTDIYGDTAYADSGTDYEVIKATRSANIDISINTPPVSGTQVIFINDTFIVNATLNCNTILESSCGQIYAYVQYNNSNISFVNLNTFSSQPFWSQSSQPQMCSLLDSESCNVVWVVNATGIKDSFYKLRIVTNSSSIYVENLTSENMSVNIVEGETIIFNQTTLSFPQIERNKGIVNKNITVQAVYGNNTGINVTCSSGDCSFITDNWIDGTNLNQGLEKNMTFTCQDTPIGIYSAIFELISNEDTSPFEVNVLCEVIPPFGPVSADITIPSFGTELEVIQNYTSYIEANISCIGVCGSIDATLKYYDRYGDGSEGSATISGAGTVINDYTYLTSDETTADNSINVNNAGAFGIGDEILIIQMQNGTGGGTVGTYEFRTISNKVGNDLTLDSNLEQSYTSGTFDTTSASITQVIRVPNYINLRINSGASITAQAWNGYTGGIVVFKASGVVEIKGSINVNNLGYRGGAGIAAAGGPQYGYDGESYNGVGTGTTNNPNDGGGGGGYNDLSGGGVSGGSGAGGGYALSGTNGADSPEANAGGIAGNAYGISTLQNRFMLGSGGGGGGSDNDGTTPGADGGGGGGSIFIVAAKVVNIGTINASGEDGSSSGSQWVGSGGGGSGGSIMIVSENITAATDKISSKGGIGGCGATYCGGDGSVGRIKFDATAYRGTTQPATGDYSKIFKYEIKSVPTANVKPVWSLSSQPQNCILSIDGSCTVSWTINASGEAGTYYNLTVEVVSNYSQVHTNYSTNRTLNIIDPYPDTPKITLISPIDSQKVLIGDKVQFEWKILDVDSPVLNCEIFINGISMANVSCVNKMVSNFANVTINTRGNTSWYINASDLTNRSNISVTQYFIPVYNRHFLISKNIRNYGTDTYLSDIRIINMLNSTIDTIPIDFVDNNSMAGSFTPSWDLDYISNGPKYYGNIYLWNLTVVPLSTTNLNYSIGGTLNNYSALKYFTIGLE